ncbi:MAG TPA: response regulator [Candidatus Thioglobus autotrophicus]|jgi:two-component system catabolic regulation response regulator CreB|nr:response regulator [Candidatus Thioglobus autotrophicus]
MQHILIVEDDRTIAESIAFILEQDSFSCQWFDNGRDALDYIGNNEVDLILLDVGLPDMSGFDVLRKVRIKSDLPVIIISARDDESDQVLGLEGLGANGYITKPFSPRLVVAHVRSQLRRDRTDKNPKSKFSINQAMQRALFHDQELTLTPAEFKILSHLIKHPNQVHTREYLMSIIWDRPHGSDEKTINTHIKSIRKRLHEIDEMNDYIETHRGIGYSLIE